MKRIIHSPYTISRRIVLWTLFGLLFLSSANRTWAQLREAQFVRQTPAVGQSLPAIQVYDEHGNDFSLGQLKGSYSVLVFGCLT